MLFTANVLQIVLCWSIVAFSVATLAVAVQRAHLSAELKDLNVKLDYLETQLEGQVKPRSRRAAVDDINYRLPSTLSPTNYKLYLHPDLKTGLFYGQETIDIDVHQNTKQIILHAHKLNISNVYVQPSLEVASYELDSVREFLIINMVEELKKDNKIKLGMEFAGVMEDKIVGLYSSSYLTEEKEARKIATSKFEPTYARQAFPCFDEPAMKAKFDITLVRPTAEYHALSNMNELSSSLQGELTEVHFATSVPMSTYLTCFIVSDFASNKANVNAHNIGNDFEMRIFATKQQLNKVDFALKTGVAVTEFYIQYFQVEYPLPKLDMAAIPDFVSGAMEHWGLVTYRETALLYDPSFSSTWNKQRIAAVVAHELAHMWFGNLVTMMWWNDLWLNEGFARYMEYKSVNEVYTDWGLPEQFLINALHDVMKFDASIASHPIIQTVANPDQITEIFDTISYEKGASVIRMLEDIVGAERFAQAVTSYLTKFKFKNAVTNDFLTEVENTNLDFNVKLFMRTWTEQMGLPVVEVRRKSSTEFILTQKRFFANIEDYDIDYDDSPFNYKWSIPLTYILQQDATVRRQWFNHDDASVTITVPSGTKWLKLNAQQVGFYRVNYETEMWNEIIEQLLADPKKFSIADRAHLLNDVFALSDASQLSYDLALDMTKYLAKETDFVPWSVAATKLQAIQKILKSADIYYDYVKYARKLLENIYEQVTWTVDEDNHLSNRLRVSVLAAACELGLSDCLQQAATKFNAWLENPTNKPEPDLREIVYYYGMYSAGDQQKWDKMWTLFVAEQDASEKDKLMNGLSAIRSPWLLHSFVELAGNENYVRRQDYFNCLRNIAGNAVGEPIVWDYVREHWPDLVARFGLNERFLGRMIPTITANFASETKLEDMQEFFAKYPEAGAGTAARKQALETVKFNIKWLQENKQKIANWLSEQNS